MAGGQARGGCSSLGLTGRPQGAGLLHSVQFCRSFPFLFRLLGRSLQHPSGGRGLVSSLHGQAVPPLASCCPGVGVGRRSEDSS